MSNQALNYSQRVLCVGLRRMTKDRALIRSGFIYWSHNLAHKDFDIADVVEALETYLGLDGNEKKALMITMHAASNKHYEELPPVPESLLNMIAQTPTGSGQSNEGSNEGGNAGNAVDNTAGNQDELRSAAAAEDQIVVAKSPQWQVIHHFLTHVALYLGKIRQDDLTELAEIIKEEGLSDVNDSINQTINQWAANGFTTLNLPLDITESDCADLAHSVYLLTSEIIGPVESDKIVHRAIDDCLTLAAATRFNPADLL